MFKSPTTTQLDLDVKERLEKITGLDSQELGIELFKVKSDLEGKKTKDLILDDSKEYDIPLGIKALISQVKVMELDKFLSKRKEEVLSEMNNIMKEKSVELFILIITDLINEGSEVFSTGRNDVFEKAMNVKLENNSVFIPGLMSRKKQVVPPLIGLKE